MTLTDHILDRYFSHKLATLIVDHFTPRCYPDGNFYAIPNPSLHTVSIYCRDTEVYEFQRERAFVLLVTFLTRGWEHLDDTVTSNLLKARR